MNEKHIENTGQPAGFNELVKHFPDVLDQLIKNKTRISYLKG